MKERKGYIYIAERDFRWQDLANLFGYHPCILRQGNPQLGNHVKKGDKVTFAHRGCNGLIFYKTFAGQNLLGMSKSLGIEAEWLLSINPGNRHGKFYPGQMILLPADINAYQKAQRMQIKMDVRTLGEKMSALKMNLELFTLLNPRLDIMCMPQGQSFQSIDWKN